MNDVLKSRKRISHFEQDNAQIKEIKIYVEQVLDAAYGCYVWPSALVLSEFLFYNRTRFLNKTILEVGAGTCLPSLTILKSTQPAHMIVTDIESILPVIHDCLRLNGIQETVWVEALEWGQFGSPKSIDYLIRHTVQAEWDTKIDYIIGSDTFYDPSEFENLLVLVSYVVHQHNQNCVFFTAYQERSPKRSIQYLLDKWDLQCRLIPKDLFEFDELKYIDDQDDESEIKVNSVELSHCRPYYIDGKALPDYHNMVQRRLHGLIVSVGDVAQWNVGGREIQCSIKSISGDQTHYKIDQHITEIEICTERPTKKKNTENGYVKSLVDIISHSFTNSDAYHILGIPTVKSILLHGVSGVGKTTIIKRVAESFACHLYEISIYDLLLYKEEEYTLAEFLNYNPLSLIINKAKHTTPSIVILRDLNALVGGEKSRKLVDILQKEIDKIDNSVCVIGLAHQLSSLPEAFKRTDIFRQHMAIPIPTMPERAQLVKEILQEELDLEGESLEKITTQISLRTSGYVARDLKRLVRQAKLKSLRRRHENQEEVDVADKLAKLSLCVIDEGDFEYALETYRAPQQIEQGTTVPKRNWKELGGYQAIKDRIRQAVLLPLQEPHLFTKLGVKPPSGLLLYGPSGSGKTAIVQALITESKMNVLSIKGPEIFSKYLGETEEKIRKLFNAAKRMAPCIIFIDEMDAIGSKRGLDDVSGGVNERVLSTLLNEMDGVEGRQGVIVIGCTNRPDQIDDAILRPGRLDQLIFVGLPTLEDRVDIIMAYMRRMSVFEDVDPEMIAKKTEFCTGADLENLFREAGTLALRKDMNAQYIRKEDIEDVIVNICERAENQILQGKLDIYERNKHLVILIVIIRSSRKVVN
ncbi:hypothetical protein G6F46_008773 [Rhizopus delemar]|nr:hypothetical protein G6F54_001865 [Rhizopus delemar]KAG1507919.1 hypothetical protein G6F53_008582 [Rhizopus delemar]KAG1592963.1 hypothetical protein G6F48_002307 [Rhizopus delemar]KAG1597388.1 hypothetical protein G6F47_007358 [Rhizopus delemar]KAG1612067.1 hypothetical protein G6F46_008773 [Rhizopus delemar]